jgi:hypothetical protein
VGGDDGGGGRCVDCAISPFQLLAPCAGKSYEATLTIQGGVPPFTWQVTSADLGGWAIHGDLQDPRRAVLTTGAVTTGVTALTVTATGSDQRSKSLPYTLVARDRCWMAYTSLADGASVLQLVDPFAAEIRAEPLDHNDDVHDFGFSPDGRYLVYSFGGSALYPHGQHLSLVQLSGNLKLNEQRLDFGEDAITSFSWSPDGSVLAVAFSVGNTGYLGAVTLPGVEVRSSVEATVGSELSWVGNELVAYHTDLWNLHPDDGYPSPADPEHYHASLFAELTQSGFSPPVEGDKAFLAPIVLLPTQKGFYTLGDPDQQYFTLLAGGGSQQGLHASASLISGNGDHSMALDGAGALRIFTAELGDVVAPVAVSETGETCTRPLAWAASADRMACVFDFADTSSSLPHGEVRFFDFAPNSPTLSMVGLAGSCNSPGPCPATGYRYDSVQAEGQARAFSRSGRWFAFTTSFEGFRWLHWIDLQAQAPVVSRLIGFESDGPSWVSFSPDERQLWVRLGTELALIDLAVPPPPSQLPFLPSGAGPGVDCSEDFMHDPQRYCASPPSDVEAVWAPDSLALAHRAADGLRVVDASQALTKPSRKLPGERCDYRCSGRLAFQPPD